MASKNRMRPPSVNRASMRRARGWRYWTLVPFPPWNLSGRRVWEETLFHGLLRLGRKRVGAIDPASAKGLVEVDELGVTFSEGRHGGKLRREQLVLGVQHLDVVCRSALVPRARETCVGAQGAGALRQRVVLHAPLRDADQGVVGIAERVQHGLLIEGERGALSGLGAVDLAFDAAERE